MQNQNINKQNYVGPYDLGDLIVESNHSLGPKNEEE